jgi:hypothetical protein
MTGGRSVSCRSFTKVHAVSELKRRSGPDDLGFTNYQFMLSQKLPQNNRLILTSIACSRTERRSSLRVTSCPRMSSRSTTSPSRVAAVATNDRQRLAVTRFTGEANMSCRAITRRRGRKGPEFLERLGGLAAGVSVKNQ